MSPPVIISRPNAAYHGQLVPGLCPGPQWGNLQRSLKPWTAPRPRRQEPPCLPQSFEPWAGFPL